MRIKEWANPQKISLSGWYFSGFGAQEGALRLPAANSYFLRHSATSKQASLGFIILESRTYEIAKNLSAEMKNGFIRM